MSEICDECKERVYEVWEHAESSTQRKYVCSDCLDTLTEREATASHD